MISERDLNLLWWGFDSVYYSVSPERSTVDVDAPVASPDWSAPLVAEPPSGRGRLSPDQLDPFLEFIHSVLDVPVGSEYQVRRSVAVGRLQSSEGRFSLTRSSKGMKGFVACLETADGLRCFVPSPNAPHTGLYFQCPPALCAAMSPGELDLYIRNFVESVLELRVKKIALSRFDLTFDFAIPDFKMMPIPNINSDSDDCELVTRAVDRHNFFQPGYTGFRVGKDKIVARAYDKLRQADDEGDKEYYDDLYGSKLGDNKSIVRIEYVVRGDALRSFCDYDFDNLTGKQKAGSYLNLSTLSDVENNIDGILAYLLQWMRFCYPSSRESSDRELLPWWSAFDAAMRKAVSGGLSFAAYKRSYRPRTLDVDPLAKQLLGITRGIAARISVIESPDDPQMPSKERILEISSTYIEHAISSDSQRHQDKMADAIDKCSATAMIASRFNISYPSR